MLMLVGNIIYLRHNGAADHAALWSDVVKLLPNTGDDGKVLREVGGQDASDAVRVQVLQRSGV